MKKNKKSELPFVSICTPTFNRRPFINALIECFNNQDYPKNKMEWIIIDDGTDKVEDLFINIKQVKYYKYNTKMTLGKKRNLMHEKTIGQIIIYMDDDDYYPPMRVSHAVKKLQDNPNALCAGSSKMYIWFKHLNQMWQLGPYGPNHATAGTFAFKRELLTKTRYNENASLAEEKEFLLNYTIPFVQLDSEKTILIFSHSHNTFDKKKILENPHPSYCKPVAMDVDYFIKNEYLKNFYINNIEILLAQYDEGKPEMKPDVLIQLKNIEEQQKLIKSNEKFIELPGNPSTFLNSKETITLLNNQLDEIINLKKQIEMNKMFINALKNKVFEKDASIKTQGIIIEELKTIISINNINTNNNTNILLEITELEKNPLIPILNMNKQLLTEINQIN
jgi:glycosyltransferase involved in cell wall biosynthesis